MPCQGVFILVSSRKSITLPWNLFSVHARKLRNGICIGAVRQPYFVLRPYFSTNKISYYEITLGVL